MKIQSVLNDIEILVKMGQQKDAMVILKAFQKDVLIEYKKWYDENYQDGAQALHSYYIEKFINESK